MSLSMRWLVSVICYAASMGRPVSLGCVSAYYVLRCLMAIAGLSFRMQFLDLCTMRQELCPRVSHVFSCGDSNRKAEWHI